MAIGPAVWYLSRMLILLSPAKTLDFTPQSLAPGSSKPELLLQAKKLVAQLRELSPKQLAKLMSISDKLAAEVHDYFANWKAKYDTAAAKQAILAFRGDVYQGLDADSFTKDDFLFAQDHLRILSGLYGVLRPLDLMQGYRLEMGTKLAGDHGKDLYAYWGEHISKQIQRALADQGDELLVNLASNEYFKAVLPKSLDCRVITPAFMDRHQGGYRVMSFFAKHARGKMANYLIRKQIDSPAGLLKFRGGGYKYNREMSSEEKPVFTRDKPASA